MTNIRSTFKRVIKSAFLVVVLLGVSNCNQFASFSGSDENHLAANPVFENPGSTYIPSDDVLPTIVTTPDNPTDPVTPDPVDPNPTDPVTPNPTDPVTPNPVNPDPVTPNPIDPVTPVVTNPPVYCTSDNVNETIVLPNGNSVRCRPCIVEGTRVVDGNNVPVCEVQRCDDRRMIFFGTDISNPGVRCDQCVELRPSVENGNQQAISQDQACRTIVPEPPAVIPPIRPVVVDDDVPVDPCVANPRLAQCVTDTPVTTPTTFTGGDGGGDGGGDPLMIDSQGVQYVSAEALRNSNVTYFNSGDLELTAPKDGIKFNLLGNQDRTTLDNGDFLHINESGKNFKYQISWVQPHQMRYRFLALPNNSGQVTGINELFGDNTFGPRTHSPFAKDGFQALMKWDRGDAAGNFVKGVDHFIADGYIDQNDAIFSKLRLWHDINGNGTATTKEEIALELIPLDKFGITYIHLLPNKNFHENDEYGNAIAYKSIVGFKSENNGAPKLGTAFDMWFHYSPEEVLEAGGATRESNQNSTGLFF